MSLLGSLKRLLKKRPRLSNNTQKNLTATADVESDWYNLTDAEIGEIKEIESYNKKYDYSNFEKIQYIGRGSSGSVVRAYFKDKVYALKSFNNDKATISKVNKEVIINILM